MEFLGYIEEAPRKKNSRDWNYVDIQCPDEFSFCDATSKIIRGMKGDCAFKVADLDGKAYIIDVLDVRYHSTEYLIRLWPYEFRKFTK